MNFYLVYLHFFSLLKCKESLKQAPEKYTWIHTKNIPSNKNIISYTTPVTPKLPKKVDDLH